MRRIRKSNMSRWLAYVVVGALLAPTTFFPSPWRGTAFAQTAHTHRVGRALVLDFEVKEGVDAARLTELALGRHAADALTLALSATGRYDVVPRSDLENALRSVSDNVLSPNKATQLKLAALPTVRAQSVFVGRIIELKVWDKPARAQVTLEVLERDVLTGEFVNAVRVTDASLPKLGRVKSDMLILEALNRATRRATEEMQARRPLQGDVSQIPSSDAVILNIGAHQGVEIGQRFAVLRGTDDVQYIGLAEVTQLSADSAVARVTPVAHSGGLRLGDRVRQIYAGAPVGVPPTGGGGGGSDGGGGGGGIGNAGGLLAGLLLLGLLAGGIGKSQKGGASAQATQNVTAAASSTGNSNLVKWSLSGAFSDLEIIGHFIHRSNFPGFAPSVVNVIDFVPGAQRQYLDAPGDYQNDVTITVTDDQTELGQLDLQTQITALTGGTIPPSTGNLPPPGVRVEDMDVTCVHTGPTLGVQQFYAVTRIVRVPRELTPGGTGQGGGGGGGQTVVAPAVIASRAGSASGGATALSPVALVSPPPGSADVAFQNVTFEFQPTAGADEYQIQVSVDPSFPPNNRFASQVIRDTRQGITLSQTFTNLIVPGAALNIAIYWRVGARNSRDPLRPQGISTSNDDGFVFSQAQTFTLREQPPPPPQNQRVLNGDGLSLDTGSRLKAELRTRKSHDRQQRRENRRERKNGSQG
jgi:hypothetical protein